MEKKKVLDFFKCATGYFLTDLQDFCGGVAKMCAPVAAAAVGAAGAAAVGTADAFLKGEQNADKNPLLTAGGFMVENPDEYWGMPAHDREYLAALDRSYPQPHHYLHPLWEEVYGDGA